MSDARRMPEGRMTPQWLRPEWPVPATVRALSTLRVGGASRPPYDWLNLGMHVGDNAMAVGKNRRILRETAGLSTEPSWLSQVHGIEVADLDAATALPPSADAAMTREPGRICAILSADCLPVLLATQAGDRVAAAHAGWRGLAAGILEATVGALACPPPELLAWMGPAIGPAHFEIGAEVRAALLTPDPGAETAIRPTAGGRFVADLFELARRRLTRLGIERVYGGGECTHANPAKYFSHRRDGATGRQATLIWLERSANR